MDNRCSSEHMQEDGHIQEEDNLLDMESQMSLGRIVNLNSKQRSISNLAEVESF